MQGPIQPSSKRLSTPLVSPAVDDPRLPRRAVRLHRKPLANPRTVVHRALLYNNGGFDVSQDGKTLCACAEYWLPDGVNNAAREYCHMKPEMFLHTFSHYSSEKRKRKYLVIDLQGVSEKKRDGTQKDVLTVPDIHKNKRKRTKDCGFGRTGRRKE